MLLRSPLLLLAGIITSFLLVLFGLVLLRGNSVAAGVVVIVAATVAFLGAAQRLRTSMGADTDVLQDLRKHLPLALIALALFFCLLAVYEVGQPRTLTADQLSAGYWLASIGCFAAGILWLEHWPIRINVSAQWRKEHAPEVLLVLAIFVLALIARLVLLSQHPFPWSGDEASVGMEARRILLGQNPDIFNTGWSGQPNLSFVPTALSMAIFGDTLFALRAVSALIGALSVVTLYLAARVLFDREVAAIAAAFVITFPFHLQFSRIGVSNIVDTFMVTLCIWLTVRAMRQETQRGFMLAGFATGLALYTYVGSRLVIALGITTVVYFLIRHRGFLRGHLWHLGTYVSAMFVMAAPMAFFMIRHPDIFMTRVAQTGIMFHGWLPQEAARTGQSIIAILLNQFERSTLVYIAQGALGNFFNSPEPYLNIFGALFFLIGMGYALQHLLDFPFAVLLLWFWAVVFLGGVLTLDPPANTRLIMTAPAVAIFLALGMQQVLKVLGEIKISGRWRTIVGTTMVGLLLLQNAMFYFGPYRTGNYFSDANSEVAEAVGLELQSLGPRYNLYMMGQPRVYAGFPTISFLAPRSARIDLDPNQAETADLSRSLPALLIATPDNKAALETIARRYPGGRWEAIPRETKPETLYYGYVLTSTAPVP